MILSNLYFHLKFKPSELIVILNKTAFLAIFSPRLCVIDKFSGFKNKTKKRTNPLSYFYRDSKEKYLQRQDSLTKPRHNVILIKSLYNCIGYVPLKGGIYDLITFAR